MDHGYSDRLFMARNIGNEGVEMERPNYYSILPAKVRYDENLSSSEKLIFSEITALINKNGYCWASNDYFAELFNVSKKTISKWINKLSDRGYIKTKLEYEKGTKNITKRVIKITSYPIHEKADTLSTKKWIPYPEKSGRE